MRNREKNNARTARWLTANREHTQQYAKQYALKRADHLKEYRASYYQEHRDRIVKRVMAYYWDDPERARQQRRKYYRSHPEVGRINSKLAKHRRRTAEGWYTADDIRRMIRQQKGKCWWCGKKYGDNYHLDHVIPIARGGTNDPSNLCLACAACNLSKHAKLPHEWNGRMF